MPKDCTHEWVDITTANDITFTLPNHVCKKLLCVQCGVVKIVVEDMSREAE